MNTSIHQADGVPPCPQRRSDCRKVRWILAGFYGYDTATSIHSSRALRPRTAHSNPRHVPHDVEYGGGWLGGQGGYCIIAVSFSRTPTCVMDATRSLCTAPTRPARSPARLPQARSRFVACFRT
eukprot:3406767-Prymnesium_polylepis.1